MGKRIDLQILARENVRSLKPYTSARDEYIADGAGMVFLDANENPFDNGVNRYPDPRQRNLKAVLARQKGVSASQILLGNGSDEVLDLIFRAFCEPGKDNIITLPPTYGMYGVLAGVNNIVNREVPLTGNFEPDVDRILAAADQRSKLIVLCSPNNPTGNLFSRDRIAALLKDFDGLLVIDEAYIDFCSNGSWLPYLPEYENLIITQTLSKAYGMAGIRLGICYACEEVTALLDTIKPPYNVNELTQQRAMQGILNKDQTELQVAEILSEREKLYQQLAEVSFVKHLYPSDANFILVQVDAAPLRYDQLLRHGIVVRQRGNLPGCENTLRLTVGTADENRKLIKALNSMS